MSQRELPGTYIEKKTELDKKHSKYIQLASGKNGKDETKK